MKKVLFGTWLQIPSPTVARIVAYSMFDWICVDLEHGAINLETMTEMFINIQAVSMHNTKWACRVPNHDPSIIARVLDIGVEYLIVPKVNYIDEAIAIIKAAKYPPKGDRGVGFCGANAYGNLEVGTNKVKIIIQIEDIRAFDDLEAMINLPSIDGAFIGPLDLQKSIKPENFMNEYAVALATFEKVVSKTGKLMGIHDIYPTEETTTTLIKSGYNFIALGVDTSILSQAIYSIRYTKD